MSVPLIRPDDVAGQLLAMRRELDALARATGNRPGRDYEFTATAEREQVGALVSLDSAPGGAAADAFRAPKGTLCGLYFECELSVTGGSGNVAQLAVQMSTVASIESFGLGVKQLTHAHVDASWIRHFAVAGSTEGLPPAGTTYPPAVGFGGMLFFRSLSDLPKQVVVGATLPAAGVVKLRNLYGRVRAFV